LRHLHSILKEAEWKYAKLEFCKEVAERIALGLELPLKNAVVEGTENQIRASLEMAVNV
jgi:hypothetical protein